MTLALILSFVGGVALFASQPPRRADFLQLPALGALLRALWSLPTPQLAPLCGFVFALGYAVLQLWELRLPVAISAILALSQSAIWTLFAWGAAYFARFDALTCAILAACWGAVLVLLEWSILPLWGTAQNFARGWSRAPQFVQFVALTGVSGAVWCLLLLASLLAQLVLYPREWITVGCVLMAILIFLGALNHFFVEMRGGSTTYARRGFWLGRMGQLN